MLSAQTKPNLKKITPLSSRFIGQWGGGGRAEECTVVVSDFFVPGRHRGQVNIADICQTLL